MATGLTKKQKEALTDKITGLIRSGPALRMTTDSSVNEMNINQISGELNRIHYRAIGKEFPTVINIPLNLSGYVIDGIGTIYIGELNIETMILSIASGVRDLGTLVWSSATSVVGTPLFTSRPIANISRPAEYTAANIYTIPDIYIAKSWRSLNSGPNADPGIAVFQDRSIRIVDRAYESVDAFKESLLGVIAVYELETPKTYTLTPQQMLQLLDQI